MCKLCNALICKLSTNGQRVRRALVLHVKELKHRLKNDGKEKETKENDQIDTTSTTA